MSRQKDDRHQAIPFIPYFPCYRRSSEREVKEHRVTPKNNPDHAHQSTNSCLTSPCLHLWRSTLGTLLADLCGLASSGGGVLSLLGLLLRVRLSLLLLALLDGGAAGSSTGLRSLGAALLDHVERGTDDGTLVLDCAAGTLLGDFLLNKVVSKVSRDMQQMWEVMCSRGLRCGLMSCLATPAIILPADTMAMATNLRDTLLVRPSVQGGPVNLARVLALEEKGLGLAILEAEDLAVTTDV